MDVLGKDPLSEYDEDGAKRYDRSGGMRRAQYDITRRAVELLGLVGRKKVLDIGCGTGFSMEILRDEVGFDVEGVDIAPAMVAIAREKGFVARVANMNALPYEDGTFDAVVSISTLQWVEGCTPDEMYNGYLRCASEMYRVLSGGGKGVVQFYPQAEGELELAVRGFRKSGFSTRLVVDRGASHQKADRKFILVEKV